MSVLVSPDNYFEYEAAHGTVTRHYYKHLAGDERSPRPTLWPRYSRGPGRSANAENWMGWHTEELAGFADRVERVSIEIIESGVMTKDLYGLAEASNKTSVSTLGFLNEIAGRL